MPINGPQYGNTLVTVSGSNFLSPVQFNQALLCKFGTYRVFATLLDSETITCMTPHFSKTWPVEFIIDIENPIDYYFTSKVIKFFFEDNI